MRIAPSRREPQWLRGPLPEPAPVEHLPAQALARSETSTFKRAHRVHILPAPPRLLPPSVPGHGGTAAARYAAAFALGLDHMGRVFGFTAAHYFDAAAISTLFFFGTGEGGHALLNDVRAMRILRAERQEIRKAYPATSLKKQSGPRHALALRRQNHSDFWQTAYYTALDFSSALGATLVGLGLMFRPALLSLAGNFVNLGMTLSLIGFFPLVVPGAIGAADRGVRSLRTIHKQRQMARYLEQNPSELGPLTCKLFDRRQRELRTYFILDGAARAALTVGGALSVFVGPVGLIPLLPAAVGILVTEGNARRMIRLGGVIPMQERMGMRDDAAYQTEIAATYRDFASLTALRRVRRKRYPHGYDTPFRPLVKAWRWVRYHQKDHPFAKYGVLDALGKRAHVPTANTRDMAASDLLDIARGLRMQDGFARAVLQRTSLRRRLQGHGIILRGKQWTLNNLEVARYVDALRGTTERTVREDHIIRDYFDAAEETLLTSGRTETHRRQRALLDLYGRFIRTRVKVPEPQPAATGRHRRGLGRWFHAKAPVPQH